MRALLHTAYEWLYYCPLYYNTTFRAGNFMVMRITTPLAKETWLRFDFSSALYLSNNVGVISSFLASIRNSNAKKVIFVLVFAF